MAHHITRRQSSFLRLWNKTSNRASHLALTSNRNCQSKHESKQLLLCCQTSSSSSISPDRSFSFPNREFHIRSTLLIHTRPRNQQILLGRSRPLTSLSSPRQKPDENTKSFHFGNRSDKEVNIDFSKLSRRQSAELEDALAASLKRDRKDGRLVDPILGKAITRKGLDWVRSVSFPSSFSPGIDENDDFVRNEVRVDVHIPTMLHPGLQTLATDVALTVQEETASFIDNHPDWHAWKGVSHVSDSHNDQISCCDPHEIVVTVLITPQSTKLRPKLKHGQHALRSPPSASPALQNITHFLAVYSCKGGVGKSTIAANLAYQLANMGGRIGLLDVDVYGPSLPLLVRPDDIAVRKSPPDIGEGMVEPIQYRGVKLMSLGYVSPNSGVPGSGHDGGAAVLRGPMAGRVVAQLLKGTNWGELDVLVLDLPPGTGDVQLEVCQSLSLSGALAVSTPSELAWSDVKKGVQMFKEMGVDTLALVENMAYFVCEGGGKHFPFGKAKGLRNDGSETKDKIENQVDAPQKNSPIVQLNSSHIFQLPISPAMNTANDSGIPLCLSRPDDAKTDLDIFSNLANAVSTDLLRLQHGLPSLSIQNQNNDKCDGGNIMTVLIEGAGDNEFDVSWTQMNVDNDHKKFTVRLFSNDGGYQKVISGADLRIRDPKTGEKLEFGADAFFGGKPSDGCGGTSDNLTTSMVEHHTADDNKISTKQAGLFPVKLTKKGHYGYEVSWADGATIIYSLLSIAKAAGGKPLEN